MRALEIVGSDFDNFSCPWCGAHDRERHLYLYMQKMEILSFIAGKWVLHFAPETHLSHLIQKSMPEKYIKCDILSIAEGVIKVDLLNICYPDNQFDLLIANHVLEHVSDDQRALSEVVRVLKPGGYAILQAPYSSVLKKTWEDEGIVADKVRLQAYGQEDHVRLFGQDIFERFEKKGLESHVVSHENTLHDYCPFKYGVNQNEPFFLYRKPGVFYSNICYSS